MSVAGAGLVFLSPAIESSRHRCGRAAERGGLGGSMELFIVKLPLYMGRFVDPGQDVTVLGKYGWSLPGMGGAQWSSFLLWEFAAQPQIKGKVGGGVKRSKRIQKETV